MTINIWIVLAILFVHWVADFVCQTSWQAENKSKTWDALLKHTLTYSAIWFLPALAMFALSHPNEPVGWEIPRAFAFTAITFACHTATDYYTSRVNSMLWEKKEVHNFFVSIGWDQLLHYIQLILTFYYLAN